MHRVLIWHPEVAAGEPRCHRNFMTKAACSAMIRAHRHETANDASIDAD
jgi:hypothetical protein